MKTKNIRKIILTAAVCSVFLTACGLDTASETSSEGASGAEDSMEALDAEIPENAVYCQKELNYVQGELSNISLNYFDDHDNYIYFCSKPTEDSNNELTTAFDCSYSYKYNDDGTIAEMSMVESDDIQTLYQFEYSEDKAVRTETAYRNGELLSTTVCTYDEYSNSLRTETNIVSTNSSYISSYEYEYDPDGRILVEKRLNDNDALNCTKRYTYDDNGNMASLETTYANSDYPLLTKYTYNSDNRLIKEQSFTGGEESEYTEYEYEFYN